MRRLLILLAVAALAGAAPVLARSTSGGINAAIASPSAGKFLIAGSVGDDVYVGRVLAPLGNPHTA
jgi:hypothetical protein